ncbi:hypothetical protein ACG0Z6_03605 [Roseateles sp. BYS180W]|uniref:Uncharacterized protein n=1 Tax=Roseateles rivi TaxID=3299028 RepID=A0ABW7FST6_9BURK
MRTGRTAQDQARRQSDASFGQTLLLAVLLHVWLILLLGNAVNGRSAQGLERGPGLQVSLRGLIPGAALAGKATQDLPGAARGTPTAPAQPPNSAAPGSPRQGLHQEQEQIKQDPSLDELLRERLDLQELAPTPDLQAPPLRELAPSRLSDLGATPPRPQAQTLQRSAPLKLDNPAPVEALQLPEPAAQLKTLSAPKADSAAAPKVQTGRISAMDASVLKTPAISAAPALPPLETAAQPQPQTQTAAAPAPAASAPETPLAHPEPPTPVQTRRLPELPRSATPVVTREVAPQLSTRVLNEPLQTAPALPSLPAAQEQGTPLPQAQTQGRVDLTGATQTQTGGAGAVAPVVGGPDAGRRQGATPPEPAASSAATPKAPLDLRLPVGTQAPARQSSGIGLIKALPTPPAKKSALEKGMEEAAREECRKAYAQQGQLQGVAAALPLLNDTLRDKGCRW